MGSQIIIPARLKIPTSSSVLSLSLALLVIYSYQWIPSALNTQGWTLALIFLATLVLAITKAFETGVVALIAISLTLVTGTLSIHQALGKFNDPVSWLILLAFFISKGIISSGLAKRVAFTLAYTIGTTPLRLSYALITAETLLAPFIPSNTARGAGLIYPIAKSLCHEVLDPPSEKTQTPEEKSPSHPAAFLLYNCFQANIITSALFLTAMAGNPIIASISHEYGYELSWMRWFMSAALPAFVCLALTPYLQLLMAGKNHQLHQTFKSKLIEKEYKNLQKFTPKETLMLFTFLGLLIAWIFFSHQINATAAALIAVTFLLANKVLLWEEIVTDKSAWTTFIWLTTLLMLSTNLKEFGVIDFVAHSLTSMIPFESSLVVLFFLVLINFFSHYFFASLTSHATTILPTFIVIGISFHIPVAPLVLSLAYSTSLSAGLTHYGTGSAPIFFDAGYWSLKQWWKLGLIHSLICLVIFALLGVPFWWS